MNDVQAGHARQAVIATPGQGQFALGRKISIYLQRKTRLSVQWLNIELNLFQTLNTQMKRDPPASHERYA